MKNNRCQQAMKLITKRHFGKLDISISEIAKQCHLAKSSVKQMAYKYRKGMSHK